MSKFTIGDLVKILVTPSCWFRTEFTDKEWDLELNMLMDTFEISPGPTFCVSFNKTLVWIANYPYAYGYNWKYPIVIRRLPSRTTAFRLRELQLKLEGKE